MEKTIEQKLPAIKQLMIQYGVEAAYIFGSAVKGSMNKESDVDFIIRFPKEMHYVTYADNYFALADALEILLKRKVELIAEKTLKNPYLLKTINQHKVPII